MEPKINLTEIVVRAGGVNALARRLGITGSAVSQWRVVPRLRVLDVSGITGLEPHLIRPDIFSAPQKEAAE